MTRVAAAGVASLAAVLSLVPAVAQTGWQLHGAAAAVHVVGPTTVTLVGPRACAAGVAPGDYTVHFAHDADGKPGSLAFAVPDGAHVALATAAAGPAVVTELPLAAAGWTSVPGDPAMRVFGGSARGDCRVAATASVVGAGTVIGVVARWQDERRWYAAMLDVQLGEVRLERRLGDAGMVLGRAVVAVDAGRPHELELQLRGFRLQVAIDGAVVVEALDGALAHGAVGVCWRGTPPAWQRVVTAAAGAERAAVAAVQLGTRATLHAVPVVTPGHWFLVELLLDRPDAAAPWPDASIAAALLLPPRAPHVLLTDWRQALGAGSLGEIAPRGLVRAHVEWPRLPALQQHVALARLVYVTADGSTRSGVSPAVPLRL